MLTMVIGEEELTETNVYQFNPEPVKISRWLNFKLYLKEYCDRSSIQGLNYLIRDISTFERIWWILVLTFCTAGCIYMILEIWWKWVDSPVVVTFATKETPIYQIPFPAVTICPQTKVKLNCINFTNIQHNKLDGIPIDPKDKAYFEYASLLCDQHENITYDGTEYVDQEFHEFLEECAPEDFHSVSYLCEWLGKLEPCESLLIPVVTEEGLCHSFNIMDRSYIFKDDVVQYKDLHVTGKNSTYNLDYGYGEEEGIETYPRRALLSGASNALTLYLIAFTFDNSYSCKQLPVQGFKVSLHIPERVARPSENFFIAPLGKSVIAAISPSLILTSKKVQSYSPDARDCYFHNERELYFYKHYSQNNCNLECHANYTLKACGCTPFYLPRKRGMRICGFGKQDCLSRVKKEYGLELLSERIKQKSNFGLGCRCMPLCTDLTYNYEISQSELEFGKILRAQRIDFELSAYMEISALNIFFKSNHFIPTERNELYGPSDFISNFGGILGLFTGFSLFSVAELIYFMSVRLFENRRRYGNWFGIGAPDENP